MESNLSVKKFFLLSSLILSFLFIGNVSAGSYYNYNSQLNFDGHYYYTYSPPNDYHNFNAYYSKSSYKPSDNAYYVKKNSYAPYGFWDYNKNEIGYRTWENYYYSDRILGNSIKNYDVYVKNDKPSANYFTVNFQFYDSYGHKKTETVTKYLNPYEGQVFGYKKISNDNYDYFSGYEVKPYYKQSGNKYHYVYG